MTTPATPSAPTPMSDTKTQFDYLLNAFEQASQSENPAANDYGAKRRALFAYVRDLEAARSSPGATPPDVVDRLLAEGDSIASHRMQLALSAHSRDAALGKQLRETLAADIHTLRIIPIYGGDYEVVVSGVGRTEQGERLAAQLRAVTTGETT